MTPFDLGNGKQVVVNAGWLQIFANGGSLGAQLTAEQEIEIGWAMCLNGMKRKRKATK